MKPTDDGDQLKIETDYYQASDLKPEATSRAGRELEKVNEKPPNYFLKKIILGALLVIILAFVIGVYFLMKPFPGRTDILVMGVSGKGYAGSDLTDSMIFVSLDHQTGKVTALSLPRDIWIPELRTKLNSVYHYQGVEGTKKIVGEILGQSASYSLIINFDVFRQIIDAFGGMDVNITRTFDDYKFPIQGKENDLCDGDKEFKCRYEHIHFEAGLQHMDGEAALKYVRSRNAEGEEGTDFARSQRQQNLLSAVKNKIFSVWAIKNPSKTVQLIKVAADNLQSDLPKEKYLDLARLLLRFRSGNLTMEVLNSNFLINPPTSKKLYDNQWVLIPKSGDWKEVQEYIKQLLISND